MAFKIVIGAKDGKSFQKEIDETSLIGKKIGDKINGETINLTGYEFLITGGSDKGGFPMRKDIEGPIRKKILAVHGVGLKKKGNGVRHRKTLCGNTISETTVQINMKVLKQGKDPLDKKEEAPAEGVEEKK